MNRLQKKCLIASAGTHLLLAVILFVGPAFQSSKHNKAEDFPLLDIIPSKTVDALVAPSGGTPPPRSQAPPQAPPAESKPAVVPQDKTPEPSKATKHETESLEIERKPKPHLPDVSTKLVTKSHPSRTQKTNTSDEDRERKLAESRRREAFNRIMADMGGASSSVNTIRISDPGPGGGGASYANFNQALRTIYTRAWVVPEGANDGSVVSVSVTIARDGTVVSSRITHRSGDPVADTSVEMVLDRVRHVVPLPDDAKEDERTVTFDFSVKAARKLLG